MPQQLLWPHHAAVQKPVPALLFTFVPRRLFEICPCASEFPNLSETFPPRKTCVRCYIIFIHSLWLPELDFALRGGGLEDRIAPPQSVLSTTSLTPHRGRETHLGFSASLGALGPVSSRGSGALGVRGRLCSAAHAHTLIREMPEKRC